MQKKKKKEYSFIWLTVNPEPTVGFGDFRHLVTKAFKKTWLDQYVYVFEQRGTTEVELGKGFHLHAIIGIPLDKKPSSCIRELGNTFKKCCDISNYHFFQTKLIDHEEYKRKQEYILGKKQSTTENMKAQKQEMDIQWRQVCQIDPYYFLNIDIGHHALCKTTV